MTQFLLRRLLLILPVLMGVLLVTFTITRLVPAIPVMSCWGSMPPKKAASSFSARFGLDKSIPEQFIRYMLQSYAREILALR